MGGRGKMNDAMPLFFVICYFLCPLVVYIGYGNREFPGDTLAETSNDYQGMTRPVTGDVCPPYHVPRSFARPPNQRVEGCPTRHHRSEFPPPTNTLPLLLFFPLSLPFLFSSIVIFIFIVSLALTASSLLPTNPTSRICHHGLHRSGYVGD